MAGDIRPNAQLLVRLASSSEGLEVLLVVQAIAEPCSGHFHSRGHCAHAQTCCRPAPSVNDTLSKSLVGRSAQRGYLPSRQLCVTVLSGVGGFAVLREVLWICYSLLGDVVGLAVALPLYLYARKLWGNNRHNLTVMVAVAIVVFFSVAQLVSGILH